MSKGLSVIKRADRAAQQNREAVQTYEQDKPLAIAVASAFGLIAVITIFAGVELWVI